MASLFLLLLLTIPAVEGHNHQHLFPFGYSVGDYKVPRVDDGSSDPLILNQPFIFFGRRYNQVIVNTNGIMSFNESFTSYSPSRFPCHHRYHFIGSCYFKYGKFPALIAPFWHDFDLHQGGNIYYRQTADSYVIQSLHTLLLNNSVSLNNNIAITNVMIATWDRVPPFGSQTSHPFNTLQVILAGDGTSSSYVAFIYDDIQWGESAQIGFNAGDGTVYFTIPGALSSATLNITQMSNVGSPGLFIYKVDGIDCSDTEVMWLDEEYTPYQHNCIENDDILTESADICGPGYIKLRIEKNVFELSAILETYNVSVYVTVTERLGIISFKDVNFILSVLESETISEVEITDGLGMTLPKLISIPKNDTRAELKLRVTRMNPLPKTLLLKIESTSKQTCFESGTVITLFLFGATQASFQLKILHVDNCLVWTAVHSTEEITSVVVEEIVKSCSCDFTPDHIINATFMCNYRENTHVIMRAQISYIGTVHANELVKIISLWARNSPHLTINETVVTIDPTCPVEVDVLAPNDCYHETKLHIIEISSSVAVCLIIIGGLIIICSKCLCLYKRNHQRKAPKCASLPPDTIKGTNEYHVNREENNAKEDYATIISDVRGADVIHVTSNEAYGKGLQSKTITQAYEVVNLQDCCVTTYNDCHSAVYDVPL